MSESNLDQDDDIQSQKKRLHTQESATIKSDVRVKKQWHQHKNLVCDRLQEYGNSGFQFSIRKLHTD